MGKVGWEKGGDEGGRVMGGVVFVVDERVGDIGEEMGEGNV